MAEDPQLAPVHRARALSSKLNEIAESANPDPELVALAASVAAFEQLTPAERARAIDYLQSRYA